MTIFDYADYKTFMKDWISTKPKGGYGQRGRIAKFLNISSVSASQIFTGDRHFTEEQGIELAEFLGFTEVESDYFLLLIQWARAGSVKLKKQCERQMAKLKKQAQNLKARVPTHTEMDENAKGQFYSNWYFSGVRLLTSIAGYDNIDTIAEVLNLPRTRVAEVVEFLLAHGLCIEKDERLQMGPQRTHLEAKSPLVSSHHRNWRLKAIERLSNIREDEMFFSGPMSLSHETMGEVRKELADVLARITKKVEPSPSEVLACVNFDLFRLT